MAKYLPLEQHLRSLRRDVQETTLSFRDIEKLLGQSLPSSAREYREWWSNQVDTSNRPQAKAWIAAGFEVVAVRQDGHAPSVRFRRNQRSRR